MSVTATKSRLKKQASLKAENPAASSDARWSRAFQAQKGILLTGLLYILAIVAESVYVHVPFTQFMRIGLVIPVIILKCFILLATMGFGVFVKAWATQRKGPRAAARHALDVGLKYLFDGDVFPFACIGLLVIVANGFYFVQKSLIHVLHPYAWDDFFIAADRFLHFGHLPNEFIVPLTRALSLGPVLDVLYFLWFVMMYLSMGYGLFWDGDLKRRLRFLWCFLLSWILLGSVLGTWFSAAGPLFYHDFFPSRPDPYADFVEYIATAGKHDFPMAQWSGEHLLMWTTNGDLVNLNAVAAFPSMHIAIAWLAMLYGFSINRRAGYAGAVFCVAIYLATVLFGFHYALDSYVSIICVSLMWWAAGCVLGRAYPNTVALKRF